MSVTALTRLANKELSHMFRIKLLFFSGASIELIRVDVSHGSHPTITAIRGKTDGAYRGAGTFQWSSAVRGMAVIFLKAKLTEELLPGEPMLSGEERSLAASLDYALTKRPNWLLEMFGVSANGTATARRLFKVTNSHRKRGGPVSLSLNLFACPPHCIEIILDGNPVHTAEVFREMIAKIESYRPGCRSSAGIGKNGSSAARCMDLDKTEEKPAIAVGSW
jgi:hypothetical protein